jgi:biotin transporter BioY
MENLLFIRTPGFLISFGIALLLTSWVLLSKRKNKPKKEEKDTYEELMERSII